MIAIDCTPLAEVDTLDLLREYDVRLAERQTLGVRTRIADIEAEIRNRASHVNYVNPPGLPEHAGTYMAATRCMAFDPIQFRTWLAAQWDEWGHERGIDPDVPLTEADHDAFDAWLTERAGAMA